MRSIVKGPEPQLLTDARRQAKKDGRRVRGSDWDDLAGKGELRIALHREQGGLCAYCCGQIKAEKDPQNPDGFRVPHVDPGNPARGGMTIEHWVPRSGYPDSDEKEKEECGEQALEWPNLLGCCVGVSLVNNKKHSHCDHARGNKRLHLHPVELNDLEHRFTYVRSTGEIKPSAESDKDAQNDIEVLCLNAERLKANRKKVIDEVRRSLARDDSAQNIIRLWRVATSHHDGKLPPFAPVRQLYLEKKARIKNIKLK